MSHPTELKTSPLKSLDAKLARMAANPQGSDFILADAKDPDLGLGISALGGPCGTGQKSGRYRSIPEFQQQIREIVDQELVDIVLLSPSNSAVLALQEKIFTASRVTPAVRANDTTDIWCNQSGSYARQPSLSFRSATIDQLQCGKATCSPEERPEGVNLGLFSITFNNDARLDRESLEAYRNFRLEAETRDFRHFLEVFPPNALQQPVPDIARYVNDCIVRTLAGIPPASRPLFLKIPYFGPQALEELVSYDPSIVVGILGGAYGPPLETLQLLENAKHHGARAALFGRRINQADNQLAMIRALRRVADGELTAVEAHREYCDSVDQSRQN